MSEKVYLKGTVYFDGACTPINPGGTGTFGVVLYIGKNMHEMKGVVPLMDNCTNNIAEYSGLLAAFEFALKHGVTHLTVLGDSQLVIRQMSGAYAVRSERLKPLWDKAVKYEKLFEKVSYEWIPRERNTEADKLSELAYEQFIASATL